MAAELPAAAHGEVEVDGRTIGLSNLDRPLFPAAGFRKRDLVAYYLAIAPAIVPHLRGRPLTLARFPDGIAGRGFLQNECRGSPAWLRTVSLRLQTGELRRYCLVDDAASLAWVANLSTVELHPYLVSAERPDRPGSLVVDLDPGPGAGLAECARVALDAGALLGRRGLAPAVKTSGGHGLHLAAGVSDATFEETRSLAVDVARALERERPEAVTADARPAARRGRVLVDWQQNAARRSTIAAYSLRAAARPRVSTPLAWDEVEALTAGAAAPSTPAEALERFARLGDLYAAARAS